MKIHEKIKKYTEKNKETSYSLADEYGASQQSVSNYLSGKNAMPIDFLCWYIDKHPDIDLYNLFDSRSNSIISEPKSEYSKFNKRDIIDSVIAVLEEKL